MIVTFHWPGIAVRRVICRWRGHNWNDWYTIVESVHDHTPVGRWRICIRCMESEDQDYIQLGESD